MRHGPSAAFARLRRDLIRGRGRRLELRLRLELALIAMLLGAFVFWQVRLRLSELVITRGGRTAGLALAALLTGLALAGGTGTAWRMRRRLLHRAHGPRWLALPVPAPALLRHEAWEAEGPLRALWVAAAAAWCAGSGAAAPGVWIASAIGFPILWVASCRLGAAAARAVTLREAPGGSLAALATTWAPVGTPPRRHAGRRGVWHRGSRPLAVWIKDAMLARRARSPRAALWTAMALASLSVALWAAPGGLRALTLPLALLAAASLGEWLIHLGALDPFPVTRSLPVSAGAHWAARMGWAVPAIAALVTAHAWAAPAGPAAIRVSLAVLAAAAACIAALAIQLQLTLFPRAGPALRLYGLALALALLCGLMVPVFGWVVLLAAVIHSARRLGRWWRQESTP